MNPITNAKNQNLMNEKELTLGHTGTLSSWHRQYKDSAWVYVGGLNYELTEGDVICVFSQYGEIVNINLVRDRKTGRSKGFAFICYEDQRSTVLATDNLNGIKLAGRIIRVDHVEKYKVPKDGNIDVSVSGANKKSAASANNDMVADFVKEHGCAPEVMKQLQEIQEKQAQDDERIKPKRREYRSHGFRERQDHRRNDNRNRQSNRSEYETSRSYRNPSPSPPRASKVKREAHEDFKRNHSHRDPFSPHKKPHHRS